MKPEGVTTQMKALDEYFLVVVFTLLLNRVHVSANSVFNLNRERVNNRPGCHYHNLVHAKYHFIISSLCLVIVHS